MLHSRLHMPKWSSGEKAAVQVSAWQLKCFHITSLATLVWHAKMHDNIGRPFIAHFASRNTVDMYVEFHVFSTLAIAIAMKGTKVLTLGAGR